MCTRASWLFALRPALRCIEVITMPTFDYYIVSPYKGPQTWFSFEIGSEGVVLLLGHLQLAMLWPWIPL